LGELRDAQLSQKPDFAVRDAHGKIGLSNSR
jgi:hypothetical protein